MKRFRFTLQALQTLRQRQEQIALEQYAQAIAARERALAALAAAQREYEAALHSRRDLLDGGASAAAVAQAQAYVCVMEEQKALKESLVSQAQRLLDQRWQKLIAARQQREALDKYSERQRAEHEYALQREERKTLDDMATRRTPFHALWKENPEARWS